MGLAYRVVCLVVLFAAAHLPQGELPALRSGDIVLQTSKSARSALIRKATQSRWSHVGLVEVAPDGVFVIEAIEPVSRTPIEVFRARGEGGHIAVLRAKLDANQREQVVVAARRFLGRHYDARFQWDDERLYCSELVAKAYRQGAGFEPGARQVVSSLHLSEAELVEAERQGIARTTELVSPASFAADERLEQIFIDKSSR